MSAVCPSSSLTPGERVRLPTALHHRPPFVRCPGGPRKAFQWSLCMHTAAAPTLLSSDRDLSVHHIQTPAPTLASLSLAQRIAALFATVSSLRMTVLAAGSSSGLGQRMVSASRPRLCSFVMTLHIGGPDVGWSCTDFSLEPSHALASLAVNRCCLVSRRRQVR